MNNKSHKASYKKAEPLSKKKIGEYFFDSLDVSKDVGEFRQLGRFELLKQNVAVYMKTADGRYFGSNIYFTEDKTNGAHKRAILKAVANVVKRYKKGKNKPTKLAKSKKTIKTSFADLLK